MNLVAALLELAGPVVPLNFDWDTKCSVCLTLTHTHPVPQRPPGPLCHKGALWLASLAVNTLPSRDAVDECPSLS